MKNIKKIISDNHIKLRQDFSIVRTTEPELSIKWAEALKQGKILFYNKQEVDTGIKNIDWTGSHINHQEWRAQLNRFFWLDHLASVYNKTGEPRLAEITRSTIEDWIDAHDYGLGLIPEYDSTLNISVRLGHSSMPGWWGTVSTFFDSPYFDEKFVEKMILSTTEQLDYLAANLSGTGNWRISQLECFLCCSLTIPGLDKYLKIAVRNLNEAFNRQIHPDGSHEEHTPGYHIWMCNLFTNLWNLSSARPDLGLRIDTERAARMWNYTVYTVTPGNRTCSIHDANHQPTNIHLKRDLFIKKAGLENDEKWNLKNKTTALFKDAGQLFIRDSWNEDASYYVFDASRWGGTHTHLSRLALSLYSGEKMLLCDPGIFSYEMSDKYAVYGKSTPAHNTINIEGYSQTEANPDMTHCHISDDIVISRAVYEGGYYPGTYGWRWDNWGAGIFGKHARCIVWLRNKCMLVFDTLKYDKAGRGFASHWQFPAGPYNLDSENSRAYTASESKNVMVQCLHSSASLRYTIYEGQENPLLGWLPLDLNNNYTPAPLFALEGNPEDSSNIPVVIVTMITPFEGTNPPAINIEKLHNHDNNQRHGFIINWNNGSRDIIACSTDLTTQIGKLGPVDCDGSLAVISEKDGNVTGTVVIDGMYLDYNGLFF